MATPDGLDLAVKKRKLPNFHRIFLPEAKVVILLNRNFEKVPFIFFLEMLLGTGAKKLTEKVENCLKIPFGISSNA